MLDTTYTWTTAFKYYSNLNAESKVAFEAIPFENQDTDLFAWLNSQLVTHNSPLENPMPFSKWFEATYNFKKVVPSVQEIAVPQEDTVLEKTMSHEETLSHEETVPQEDTQWNRLLSLLGTANQDEQYLVLTQLGLIEFSLDTVSLPSGSTCYKTYCRKLKAFRTKFST